MATASYTVSRVASTAFADQKPGTSGLRRKVDVFQQPHYLENFVQSIVDEMAADRSGSCMLVSGDGRYLCSEAGQTIVKMLAGNGFKHIVVGTNFLMSTPAVCAEIRRRQALGGIILTASHNPGGPEGDFGVKFNGANGGAAPEKITNAIFERSKRITQYQIASDLPDVDVSKPGEQQFGDVRVEVVDGTSVHVEMLQSIFDFDALRKFVAQPQHFSMVFDAMHGVAGPTARAVLVRELGLPDSCLMNDEPKPDFGGGHPDPNLTYAQELVQKMGLSDEAPATIPDFGCAADGDMDRNMILGRSFFVTPSDSLAVIAANAKDAIPFFAREGLRGVARSMPTSQAVDRVATQLDIPVFEVPTGWKFFCNLMDSGRIGICGEESFGTGSDHLREKDGMWAVLAWLSIIEFKNRERDLSTLPLMSVQDIVHEHWMRFGRNFYTRYDYENVDAADADRVFDELLRLVRAGDAELGLDKDVFALERIDEFSYNDPVDGSVSEHQGIRFLFHGGHRIVFRRSGTGSVGATIRVYIERLESRSAHVLDRADTALQPLVDAAITVAHIEEFTGRKKPSVIT